MTSTINNGCEVFKRGCVVAFVFGMMTAGLMSAENFYKKDDLRKQEITHVARR
jgi:hypothetical protein